MHPPHSDAAREIRGARGDLSHGDVGLRDARGVDEHAEGRLIEGDAW